LGDYPKAVAEINRLRSVTDYPALVGRLGYVYAKMGDTARAKAILIEMEALARTRYVSSYFIAWVHAALGEKEQAVMSLERAYEERSELLVQADDGGLRTDPAWDGLQAHPRFQALLKKVGLDVWPR
jgi:hypothetical protein